MRVQYAYCSACDRQVQVMVKDEVPEGQIPSAADASNAVCLAYGEWCTGSLCPLFAVPTEQMKESFERQARETAPEGSGGSEGSDEGGTETSSESFGGAGRVEGSGVSAEGAEEDSPEEDHV